MARSPSRQTSDGVWTAQGGLSRNFVNDLTGEKISRRQFDKRYGNLAKQGFTSYEAKAKATPEPLRKSRPAINRGSDRRLRTLNPLTERQSRDVVTSFLVFYDGNGMTFMADANRYRPEYDGNIDDIVANKKIIAISLIVKIINKDGREVNKTIQRLIAPDDAPRFGNFINDLLDDLYKGDETQQLIYHVRFKKELIPVSKRKQDIRKIRTLKTKRGKRK